MLRYTFRPPQHLKLPAEFDRVYARRCTSRRPGLTIFGAANDLPHSRIGLSVSRKHGNAVVRNRLKRLLREAFRLVQHELPAGLDLVLIPERGRQLTLEQYQDVLRKGARDIARKLQGPPP